MKLKFKDLWHWGGGISRVTFLTWAILLFGLKYNLDRLIVNYLFHQPWSFFSYLDQPLPGIEKLSPDQSPEEYLTLLLCSLPFLWAGVMLSIKRLRSAQLPLWLAVLFVVPIVKWFLFLALALVPERGEYLIKPAPRVTWLPSSMFASALFAIAATVMLALVAMVISTTMLGEYGWGLFVGVPFSMGFFSSLIYGARTPRRLRESLAVAAVSVGIAGVMLLALAFEGAICLVMAAPLALALALMGAMAGHVIQVSRRPHIQTQLFCIPILALP